MSLVWKVLLEAGGFLFTKLSPTEVQCNECQQPIQTPNRGPANLKCHLSTHPQYQKQFEDLEKAEEAKTEGMQQGMAKFVVRGKGELSALDKKILHHITCTNQPFAVVEAETFKALLSPADQGNLKGRHHYTNWVMPRVYAAVKKEVVNRLNNCSALSFTSDIWSEADSFISLTAHGIDSEWKRHKFILCVRHFPGSHNSESIGVIVKKMLEEWGIVEQKQHVFLRDEGANMKKAFEDGNFLHADCGAHKINLVVNNSLFRTNEIKSLLCP